MENKTLYDISEVCKMLDTTSRTLRFYEKKGIITSTVLGNSMRRQYTEEQLAHIRNVLVLRTLGLSLKSISELQSQKQDLKEAILSKRTEIYASIDSRIQEINLLNDALSALQCGENIFIRDWNKKPKADKAEIEIAHLCTDAILRGNSEILYQHIGTRLANYMPKDVFDRVRNDIFAPLGSFTSFDSIAADTSEACKIYSYVRFTKFGLKITFVFNREKIDGLWLGYYDINRR